MSKKEFLNEDEINKFLARSDDEDEDSDWDNIGEVDADDYLKTDAKPASKKTEKLRQEKAPKRKDVVTFRKIKDVGIDALFAASTSQETASEPPPSLEEEEKEYEAVTQLNSSGLFVEKRLRDLEHQTAEERIEAEIRRAERTSWNQPSLGKQQNSDWSPPASSSSSLSQSQAKDYFTPCGTSIRIVKPRISMTSWQDKIVNRKVCGLSQLSAGEIENTLSALDWLTVGVVVYEPDVRRTRGGSGPPYSIWRLSDLENLDRTVSLFLFGAAHQALWKEAAAGLVVALLRPRLSNQNGGKGGEEAGRRQEGLANDLTLTVDNPQQALVLGLSKDFATCSSRTKAGAMCKRIVNKALCDYCEFHVRQLYRSSGNSRPGFSQAIGVQAKRLAGKGRGRTARSTPLPPSRAKDLSANAANSQLRLLSKLSGPGATQLASHISQMTGRAPTTSQMSSSGGQLSLTNAKQMSVLNETKRSVTDGGQMSVTSGMKRSVTDGGQMSVTSGMKRSVTDGGQMSVTSGMRRSVTDGGQMSVTSERLASSQISRKPAQIPGSSSVPASIGRSASDSQLLRRSGSSALSSQLTSFQAFFQTHESARPPHLSDPAKDLEREQVSKPRPMDAARARAIAVVRAKGGVKAMLAGEKQRRLSERLNSAENLDPSGGHLSSEIRPPRKRPAADLTPFPVGQWSGNGGNDGNDGNGGNDGKRRRLLKAAHCANEEELLLEIERGSSHKALVAEEEVNQEERYFRSLEFREKYEEKLASVREHPVPVVSCARCGYRAEGRQPNEVCLREHPAAVQHGKGLRRYFVCADCKERTTSLEKIPTKNCRKCGGENFRRTGMLRERRGPKLVDETLLPRGEEHSKFLSA